MHNLSIPFRWFPIQHFPLPTHIICNLLIYLCTQSATIKMLIQLSNIHFIISRLIHGTQMSDSLSLHNHICTCILIFTFNSLPHLPRWPSSHVLPLCNHVDSSTYLKGFTLVVLWDVVPLQDCFQLIPYIETHWLLRHTTLSKWDLWNWHLIWILEAHYEWTLWRNRMSY